MAADSDPRWAPDSASVFFLSDRTGSRQLYRVRVGGGEAEVLTDWRGEISHAWPLADARLVAVVATDEPIEEDNAGAPSATSPLRLGTAAALRQAAGA